MSEIRLPPAEAEALVEAALEASNTSPENAASVARALVGAELCGQGGHGLRRAPAYAAQAKAGKVNGRIAPEVNRIRPGTISVDAGFGFAFPALEMAIGALAEITPGQGIAAREVEVDRTVPGPAQRRMRDARAVGRGGEDHAEADLVDQRLHQRAIVGPEGGVGVHG